MYGKILPFVNQKGSLWDFLNRFLTSLLLLLSYAVLSNRRLSTCQVMIEVLIDENRIFQKCPELITYI